MNHFMQFIFVVLSILIAGLTVTAQQKSANLKTPEMFFGYTTRIGVPFAKDPHVIRFGGRYLMYFSIPAHKDEANPIKGWGTGIAKSKDLSDWKKKGFMK